MEPRHQIRAARHRAYRNRLQPPHLRSRNRRPLQHSRRHTQSPARLQDEHGSRMGTLPSDPDQGKERQVRTAPHRQRQCPTHEPLDGTLGHQTCSGGKSRRDSGERRRQHSRRYPRCRGYESATPPYRLCHMGHYGHGHGFGHRCSRCHRQERGSHRRRQRIRILRNGFLHNLPLQAACYRCDFQQRRHL